MKRFDLSLGLRRILALLCAISLACVFFGANTGAMSASSTAAIDSQPTITTWRVYIHSAADLDRLTAGHWDLLEARGHAKGMDYLLVQGDDATAAQLRSLGFTVEVDHITTGFAPSIPQTYFFGYHTIAEHYQHLDDTVALHPDLAITATYGVSWLRSQSLLGGYDLKAICITKLQAGDCVMQPGGSKPRFFLMAAIHARELTTAEMAWRWIDLLVNGYNVDPDITALLNSSEMWVVPLTNPDGRAVVEQGGDAPLSQRKNVNNLLGACNTNPIYLNGNQYGIDLNRNASFQWGVASSSTDPCDLQYQGVSAASEPEQQSLETLMTNLFGHQRVNGDTNGTMAVPITATGAMLSLHSYSDLVLLPWGYTSGHSPNDAALRNLAFHMSYFNDYVTGQPPEALYPASGTSDDWAYGNLGIAGFTFEMGPLSGLCIDFTPPYWCQDNLFWPLNRPAFLYEAKTARQPYSLGLGPTVAVSVTTTVVPLGGNAVITAVVSSDLLGNNGYGRPTPQAVSAAEYSIDTPPWITSTVPVSMSAIAGAFGSNSVTVSATINTTGLSIGRHLVYVHGRSADGYWGPVTALWLMPSHQYILPLIYR